MSDLIADSNNKKKGLGRGLGSLLGGSEGMASASSTSNAFGSIAQPQPSVKPAENAMPVMNTQVNTQAPQKTVSSGFAAQATAPIVSVSERSGSAAGSSNQLSTARPQASQSVQSQATFRPTQTNPPGQVMQTPQVTPQTPQAVTAGRVVEAVAPSQAAAMTEGKVWQVAIDKLQSGEYQPRQLFDREALAELANSIKANGILQPIVARKKANGSLEIVAGERRWRAAQLAGLHEVPVLLRNFDDRQALEMAIIENVQREDLNPIEEAEGYSRLLIDFNLSQQAVAEKVGKERATIANAVRLLQLPISVRDMVAKSEISPGHAKVLLGLSDPAQIIELAKKIVAEKLAVRKLEKLISDISAGKKSEATDNKEAVANRLVAGMSEDLQRLFGTKVSLDYKKGTGKVAIHFYSDDELTEIVEKLKAGCQK